MANEKRGTRADIGVFGALSIGVGGIIGGGFFATFGLAIVGARGATYLSYLVGGVLALITAYSYVRLTLRYPGPGGTVGFVRISFGTGLLPAATNVLLIFSYVAIMAIYARALASYSVSFLPADERELWRHVIASGAILALGGINLAGAALMEKFENAFNFGKLAVLAVFIVAGFALGTPDWRRLGPSEWVPVGTIISSGMLVFLSYEGFELISNSSDRIRDPRRTLPIAFYGSVVAAMVIYALAVIVAIGHMSFADIEAASDSALSATAERFLGSFGFGLMTFGAIVASASAINADFFGAEQLPVMLAEHRELPGFFGRMVSGRAVASLATIAVLALLAVNLLNLHALSAATSGGFLLVYAVANMANARLAKETNSVAWISFVSGLLCIAALGTLLVQLAQDPATRSSAVVVLAVIVASLAVQVAYRSLRPRGDPHA